MASDMYCFFILQDYDEDSKESTHLLLVRMPLSH